MWSASLWQVLEEIGRDEALRLVLQSHFFLEKEADYADAVQAVFAADRQHFGGAHEALLTRVFSDRGFLLPQLPLTWFHVAKQSPALRLPADGSLLSAKLRLEKPGSVPLPDSGSGPPIEVYVSLAHPFPGDVEMVLRSPHGSEVALSTPGRFLRAGPIVFGLTAEPLESLDLYAGEPLAGVWTLRLRNESFDDGSLAEWGLRFRGFVRGDMLPDGALDISDAIALLRFLFAREEAVCPEAGDVDDDGSLTVSDAIRLLLFIVGMAEAPAQPYPEPGEDLTPDSLSCEGGRS
jgi:subtilisin-like proprotein convertase family protein